MVVVWLNKTSTDKNNKNRVKIMEREGKRGKEGKRDKEKKQVPATVSASYRLMSASYRKQKNVIPILHSTFFILHLKRFFTFHSSLFTN